MTPEGKTRSSLGRSLADQLKDLEDPMPKDFDPEDQDEGLRSDDDRSVADDNAGREHYEDVGKSKLRKPQAVSLGKEYAGSKVSRADLEAESDDDPFAKHSEDEDVSGEDDEEEDSGDDGEELDEDDEIDSADAFGESDEERFKDFKFRASKQSRVADVDGEDESDDDEEGEDGMELDGSASDQDSEEISEGDSDALSGDEHDEDESDLSGDEDEEEDDIPAPTAGQSDERDELRRLMATDQKSIAATISQAAKADAAKGFAVKQQRSAFDALLNTRIKLQKGLTSVNALPDAAKEAESIDEEAIRSAESAALALWTTLEDLRLALADAQSKDSSKKRKRPSPVSSTTSSASLWKRMMDLETESVAHRRATLDKWSVKVRGSNATLPNARGKLLGSASGSQQTITAVLDAHIATENGERASKRSRQSNGTTSNSDAPEPVYDDTLFYQSLLRDLVEQRMSSSDAITNGVETLHIQLPAVNPTTGMRKDKVKRAVDTKASKGRKMRYTVHEKLQNFLVPEDRGTWTNKAREEFFASLLGKTASGQLREEDDEEADQNGVESDEDAEEGGLRLFRS
ncbi:transcription factor AATF/Che-1, putative [Paecilomyces variotii No. 5]|uniref:Protein BFR2 n=1 Tax=Byssochlamys spectabilis (strain No. 5 / NBRC 109023) TaxID=1356009 RepID=V5I353_BYSSN|nr:transcription factor AATF/Che-1, putative [Paecilomyces variotii No. 5]